MPKAVINKRRHTKLVREGQYAAVEVELIETGDDWSPYLSLDDGRKLMTFAKPYDAGTSALIPSRPRVRSHTYLCLSAWANNRIRRCGCAADPLRSTVPSRPSTGYMLTTPYSIDVSKRPLRRGHHHQDGGHDHISGVIPANEPAHKSPSNVRKSTFLLKADGWQEIRSRLTAAA
jgi:hypothetical protein